MGEHSTVKIGIYMENAVDAVAVEMMVYGYMGKHMDEKSYSTRIVTKVEDLKETLSWYDVLFCQMDDLRGDCREQLKFICQYNAHVVTVFVTRVFEDGFLEESILPGLFLWRPMTKDNFAQVFEESLDRVKETKQEKYLVWEAEEGIIRVAYGDIIYLESYYRKVYLFTSTGQEYTINGSLSEIAKELERDSRFLRVHQSYLINMQHIAHMTYDKVEMDNQKEISISAVNRPAARKALMEYLK